jgi:hypothetical protein
MLRKSILGAAGLLTVAGSLSFHGCSSEKPGDSRTSEASEKEATGSVALALTLPSGITINTVTATVTGPGDVSRTSNVDVTNSSILRFRVGNLPVGPGYTMTLSAITADGANCAGTEPFAVENAQVTDLMMVLTCANTVAPESDTQGDLTVNVDVETAPALSCPVVTGISSLPLEAFAGGVMELEGFASSTSDVTYAWTGTGGTFSTPASATANFTCQGSGERTLTFAISKPGCPGSSGSVTVSCSPRTFSSSASYLVPVAAGVTAQAILSVGDAVGVKPDGVTPYRMVGIPDGLGAFDNNDGTFTLLANQELGAGTGVARAHGGNGAFVSRWRIRKSDLGVVAGQDLIQSVQFWNTATSAYAPAANVSFGRFCSADLAPASAFYHAPSGLGLNAPLFMNGEESGDEGKPMAHELNGASWELPRLGNASWENLIASPFSQQKTIVVGTDDSTPGQVYVYVGTKTNTGNNIERAGLSNGSLFGVTVAGVATEPSATGIPTGPFTMTSLGNVASLSGATLEANSNTASVTRFNRPEDGAWDPAHPNDFYFVTTNSFNTPSRLWRLRFTDIATPETGGTIEMMLTGSEGHRMLDNLGMDARGHIMLNEDVGDQARLGQVFRYDIATDTLTTVAQHDPARFTSGAAMFLTADEEATGIIDATALLGAGYWLVAVQAHYTIAGELVQGGQFIALYDPGSL